MPHLLGAHIFIWDNAEAPTITNKIIITIKTRGTVKDLELKKEAHRLIESISLCKAAED